MPHLNKKQIQKIAQIVLARYRKKYGATPPVKVRASGSGIAPNINTTLTSGMATNMDSQVQSGLRKNRSGAGMTGGGSANATGYTQG